jgi:hypothetical protein
VSTGCRAATVRALSRLVRLGELVTFKKPACPVAGRGRRPPAATMCIGWIIDAFRAIGVNSNLGEQVASLLG